MLAVCAPEQFRLRFPGMNDVFRCHRFFSFVLDRCIAVLFANAAERPFIQFAWVTRGLAAKEENPQTMSVGAHEGILDKRDKERRLDHHFDGYPIDLMPWLTLGSLG